MVHKRLSFLLVVLCSFLLGDFAAAAGLVAWWKMDDANGTVAEDSAGDANGTLVNGGVWTTGVVDGALDLDGSDDHVSVPGVSGSGPVNSMTIACWLYPEITADYKAIYNHNVFTAGSMHFQFATSSKLELAVVGTSSFHTARTFSTSQWYHVAVVYSNNVAGDYVRFYINGAPESPLSVGTAAQVDLTKIALIGGCDMGGGVIGRHFDGKIDDLRIYDGVISETEIRQLVGSATSPVGTAFTFQGRLLDANAAGDGVYDLQFKLFDCAHEGLSRQLGGDVNRPDVNVLDGYFTVELDFGNVFFTDEARWLEIGVRPGDSNDAYETLRPRQRLTGVPYALREQKQIANLQKQTYTGSPASVANIEDCTQTGDGTDCQQKMIVGVDLHEGFPIILDAIKDPGGIVEARIEIEKQWRQPAATIHSFDVHLKVIMGAGEHEFDVSPARAVYNSKADPNYPGVFHIIASLVRDSRIILNISADKIKWVTAESPGDIMFARLEPYEPSASETQLKVRIKNDGDITASYMVTVTDHDPAIEPMVQQTRLLESQEEVELTFNLRTSEKFTAGSRLKVSMYSARGKLYEFLWVVFP